MTCRSREAFRKELKLFCFISLLKFWDNRVFTLTWRYEKVFTVSLNYLLFTMHHSNLFGYYLYCIMDGWARWIEHVYTLLVYFLRVIAFEFYPIILFKYYLLGYLYIVYILSLFNLLYSNKVFKYCFIIVYLQKLSNLMFLMLYLCNC